jgi:hypothetical protein
MLRAMETRKTIQLRWTFDRGLTRPLLAYLVIVTLGVWVFQLLQEATQGRDALGALVAVTTAFRNGLVALPFFFLLLLPAMVLTIGLVHRFQASTIAARAAVGAASWVAWGLFLAISVAVASRVVLVPETLARYLILLGTSGGAYSLLAFDGYQARTGKALILLALTTGAVVVLGSMWMAGRWGGTASA